MIVLWLYLVGAAVTFIVAVRMLYADMAGDVARDGDAMGAAALLGLAFAYLWPLAALAAAIYLLFHRGALDRLFMSGRSKRDALLRERERRIAELERDNGIAS